MNDFDFLVGEWTIANRRLRERLIGSDDWEEFESTSVVHGLFDGAANVDEITFPTKSFKGLTLRLFDPEREEWSLYWANSQTGVLFPPVVGRFNDGRGEFYGDDVEGGTPVRVRISGPRSPRHLPAGSRPSRPTAARPGKRTGSWISPEPESR
jgi:hypothetical protein